MIINLHNEGSLFDMGDDSQDINREERLIHVPTPEERAEKEKEINKLRLDEMEKEYSAYLDFAKKYQLYHIDSKGRKACPYEISKVLGNGKVLKKDWVTFYAILSHSSNVFLFLQDLSEKENALLQDIAINHCMFVSDIEKIVGKKVTRSKKSYYYWEAKETPIPKYAMFFQLGYASGPLTHRTYIRPAYLKLRPDIREAFFQRMFREHLEMRTIDTLPEEKTLRTYNAETSILLNHPTLVALYDTKQIAMGKSKVSATTVKNIEKGCDITEFFPHGDKDASRLCAHLIANTYTLFAAVKGTRKTKKPEENIKTLITEMLGYMYYQLPNILMHIKGFRRNVMYDSHVDNLAEMVQAVVAKYTRDGWLDITDLTLKVRTFNKNAEAYCLLLPSPAYDQLSLTNTYTGEEIYFDKVMENITHPFIKAYLFLMAAFGVVEIAYDEEPEEGASCYFDTLRFVRLTDLGKYVLGVTNKYEHKAAQKKKYFEVDDTNLIVKSLEEHNPYLALLNDISKPISKRMYKVTYESFLNNCNFLADINNKEQMFRDYICKTPPANWEQFFQEVKSRCHPLKALKKQYSVMTIPADNKELQRIILSDPTIRKYSVKAEGYMLLVEESNRGKVADALKKYGYLL